jgi:hypothetical protein
MEKNLGYLTFGSHMQRRNMVSLRMHLRSMKPDLMFSLVSPLLDRRSVYDSTYLISKVVYAVGNQ